MMKMKRLLLLVLAAALCCALTSAALGGGFSVEEYMPTDAQRILRGYDAETKSYQYISFGSYPYEKDGTVRPCTWRILDVEDDYAFLLEEYVIDFMQFHTEKKDQPEWKDYLLYTTMNTTMADTMFTEREKNAVRYSDELGWLYILDNEEWMNSDYGFRHILTRPQAERECSPTPYARANPESYIDKNGKTWYWSRSCRHTAAGGYEHILGYNGHISMAGFLRWGGVRPVCHVDMTMLDHVTGSGTLADPYVFEIIDR